MEDHLYTVLNCYGPAKEEERDAVLEELNEIITNLDRNNLIVCGDFNMIYNNDLDNIARAPHSNREGGNFLNILKVFELEDSSRFLNNNVKEFTWSRNAPYAARRLYSLWYKCSTTSDQFRDNNAQIIKLS